MSQKKLKTESIWGPKNSNQNWVLWGQICPWTWLESAWSCLILNKKKRSGKKNNFQRQTLPCLVDILPVGMMINTKSQCTIGWGSLKGGIRDCSTLPPILSTTKYFSYVLTGCLILSASKYSRYIFLGRKAQFFIGIRQEKGRVECLWEFQIFPPGIIAHIFENKYLLFQKSNFTMKGALVKVAILSFFSQLAKKPHHTKNQLSLGHPSCFFKHLV